MSRSRPRPDLNLTFDDHHCQSQPSTMPQQTTAMYKRHTIYASDATTHRNCFERKDLAHAHLILFKYICKSKKHLNMENAELYHKSNAVQKRDGLQCLEEYAQKIKWKKEENKVLDIGSGDGSFTTNILTKFLPSNCTTVMGCDKSEKMVKFAREHYASNFMNFTMLDIEGGLPDELRGQFDFVFSNYALHWITQQELAFTNIYNLMTSGGTCLLVFLGHVAVYTIYRTLALQKKWNTWMRDVEHFVSPYHDSQNPEKEIEKMMTSIGFNNIDVRCTEKSYTFTGVDVIKNFIAAINPFKIPQELMEDFQEDCLKIMKDLKQMDYDQGSVSTKQKYRLITIFAQK